MFPLSFQMPAIAASDEKTFIENLKSLNANGFSGCEPRILDFEIDSISKIKSLTAEYNIKVTRISTGALASRDKIFLSDSGEGGRKAVSLMKQFTDYAAEFKAAVIMGFIKGPANLNREEARKNFVSNLSQAAEYAKQAAVPLVIEATNHYETSVAITLAEAVEIAQEIKYPLMQILPDTYHMNIEEVNSCAELWKYKDYFDTVHLSDNNRFLPGYGSIDFKEVISALAAMGFKGYLCLEGNIKNSFAQDVKLFADLYSVIMRGI